MEGFNFELVATILSGALFVYLLIFILYIIGLMKVFDKFGKPAWAALVPIYNFWVLFEIVGLAPWLSLVPIVNGFLAFYAMYALGAKFNKSVLFSLGLVFFAPIFIVILGFGSANLEEKIKLKPNLMAKDPASSGKVDLMETDPITTIPDIPVFNKEPIVKEMPSLEDQMATPKVVLPIENNEPVQQSKVESSVPNAFDMKLPKLKEVKEEIDIEESNDVSLIEQLDLTETPVIKEEIPAIMNLHKTQKFCPQCVSPNDILNKFCISCGYDFDSK